MVVGSIICIETHKDEQTHPWVIGSVTEVLHDALVPGAAFDSAKDAVRLDKINVSDRVLEVLLYEALQPGSTTYTPSDLKLIVAGKAVRVTDVELVEARSFRGIAPANTLVSASRQRYKISDESLLEIRAEMPTESDDWEVEAVSQYRVRYGVEQWLLKWKGYGEDRNTWEPWGNLLAPAVVTEAQQVRAASLPTTMEGLSKVTLVALKAVLLERGLDASGGTKAVLFQRLLKAAP